MIDGVMPVSELNAWVDSRLPDEARRRHNMVACLGNPEFPASCQLRMSKLNLLTKCLTSGWMASELAG